MLPRSASAVPPADGWVIWQSNRQDARHEVYRARADGSEITRMTQTGGLGPFWAPDGRWIVYRDDASIIYLMRPDGSELQTLATGWPCFWLHDNSGFMVAQGSAFSLYDPETKEAKLLFHTEDFPQFAGTTFQPNAMTHDNRYLLVGSHLYMTGYTGANGFFTSEYSSLVVDLFHKDRVYFVGSGCWPFSPPAGDLVFHICANCPTHPDIYRMSLADLATRSSYAPEVAHEDADWGHEYNPRVSNDNRWMVYMASAGCHDGPGCDYDIWLHELGAGPSERSRVTQDPGFDGYPQIYVGPLWQKVSQPRLLLTPSRLTFYAGADATPAAQTIKAKNSGGGTLGAVLVTPDPSAPWLDVRQADASTMTFALLSDFITRGIQHATVTVTVDGALGSPVSVPVTLYADESFPYPEGGAPDSGEVDAAAPQETEIDSGAGTPDAGTAAETFPYPEADAPQSSEVDTTAPQAIGLDSGAGTPDAGTAAETFLHPESGAPESSNVEAGAPQAARLDSGAGTPDAGAPAVSAGGGCGCALGGMPRAAAPLWMLGLALAAVCLRRRR